MPVLMACAASTFLTEPSLQPFIFFLLYSASLCGPEQPCSVPLLPQDPHADLPVSISLQQFSFKTFTLKP